MHLAKRSSSQALGGQRQQLITPRHEIRWRSWRMFHAEQPGVMAWRCVSPQSAPISLLSADSGVPVSLTHASLGQGGAGAQLMDSSQSPARHEQCAPALCNGQAANEGRGLPSHAECRPPTARYQGRKWSYPVQERKRSMAPWQHPGSQQACRLLGGRCHP